MKRLVVVLSSLLVLPAFAEVVPTYYDEDLTFSDVELNDVDTGAVEEKNDAQPETTRQATSPRTSARATTTARTAVNRAARTPSMRTNSVRSRVVSGRGTTTPMRTTSVSTRRGASTTGATQQRPGSTARAASINTTTTLYNPNAVVQSRGGTSAARASIATRAGSIRAASVTAASTTPVATAESATETTNEMNTMKALTEYCQAQYASCMDNYCNALDDNQGRCTCSKNLKNYEKTEAALEAATEALQDVARDIQYIGLSADQITTLFAETEAELSMKNAKDNSAMRSSLDRVKRMVVDVKSGTASVSDTGNTMNFDLSGLLNFDMGDFGFDLSTFMNTTSNNTNSISNQRGESLYKTAVARCRASVLNSCTAQGVDAAVVTNSYDLEIDKACLAYERALTESNQQMTQTVANAKEVLKRARLMVAQNKNEYNLRQCVQNLESCMQDDYVCGSDYESCMDPTGQYIVNGAVVVGSMPGNNTEDVSKNSDGSISSTYSHENLFNTWTVGTGANAKNPWAKDPTNTGNNGDAITLVDYINQTVVAGAAQTPSDKMSGFLQNKIGYHDDSSNKDYGMCMEVLNKCQDYTYETKGSKKTYKQDNEVIKNFMQRALVQIKMQQDELLASYATDCVKDVQNCLSSNSYDDANPDSTKSKTAINSCYAQIKTCMSVNGNIFGNISSNEMKTWVTGTYASIEMFESTPEIRTACESITDPTECGEMRGYCLNSDGSTTSKGLVCTWTTNTSNPNGGTCSMKSGTTCN